MFLITESLDSEKPVPKIVDVNKWEGEDEDDDIKVRSGRMMRRLNLHHINILDTLDYSPMKDTLKFHITGQLGS